MNSRQAIEEIERLDKEFLEQVNNISERRNLTKLEAVSYLVDVANKSNIYTDAQKLSIELRAKRIKKQL